MAALLKIPNPEQALAAVEEAARKLAETMMLQVEAQFEADDLLEQLIAQKIGTTNEVTGKVHSYTSAENAVKNEAHWRNQRREVVRLDGEIEYCKTQLERSTMIAKLAVAQATSRAA